MIKFRLFSDVNKNAVFTEYSCTPGHSPPFLDSEYFDGDYAEDEGICLKCLHQGIKPVFIGGYLREKISNNISTESKVDDIVKELERTPPVPWIQYNDWPLCCNDAMQYCGEYSNESAIDEILFKSINELWNIIDNNGRQQAETAKKLTDSIEAGMTVCFIFRCVECNRMEAICQSY